MRRNRRLLLMDRTIPFLAAFVGLVALAGAVLVQITAETRNAQMAEELTSLREGLDALARQVGAEPSANGDMVEAMLALQQRIERLETEQTAPPPMTGGALPPLPAAADGPIEDCIPTGTRFMTVVGDEVAICQTAISVRVAAVTDDNVLVDGLGVIAETAARPIPGSNCSLTVLSADGEGFAELRVSCL